MIGDYGTSLCDLARWAVRHGGVPMPLPLETLQSAVRVTTFGDLLGTGFLVRVRSEASPRWNYPYVLTAHHVIDTHVGIEVEIPIPFANGALYPPVEVKNWRQPLAAVDLALAPLYGLPDLKYQATWLDSIIPFPGLPTPDLGGRIYYVGIFQRLDRPMARSGTIGALDQTGISHSGGRYDFNAHLVDCRSYRGFSGSPCVVELGFPVLDPAAGPSWVGKTNAELGRPLPRLGGMHYFSVLCGMFTSHFSDEDHADSEGVVSRYGVGVMLPSSEIRKALMTDDACEERRQWDVERAATEAEEQPPLQDASFGQRSEDEGEYSRFEDLTRNLVNVPKKEIDEKRKDES